MTSQKKQSLIFIPCYNCENQIRRVIDKLPQHIFNEADILIVDNSSTDSTLNNILISKESHPKKDQIKVMKNQSNYGLGGSFKSAFNYARENGYKFFAIFHGDDQAKMEDLLKLMAYTKTEQSFAALFGARFHKNSKPINYSKKRHLANLSLNLLVSALTLSWVSEIGSGLNLFKIENYSHDFIESLPNHIAFDLQILLYSIDNKLRYQFIPISWESSDETSTVNDLSTGITVLKELFLWKLSLKRSSMTTEHRPWMEVFESSI